MALAVYGLEYTNVRETGHMREGEAVMSADAVSQIVAVLVGGLIAIAGGFLTTVLLENRRQRREARNLALAFRGEIGGLMEHIEERGYLRRFEEVIAEIEASGEPFYVPMRIRFQYDRVYDANVERIGMLAGELPALIPLFYTRFSSVLEDLVNMGEGVYEALDLPTLLRVYRDLHRILQATVALGERIEGEIEAYYGVRDSGV